MTKKLPLAIALGAAIIAFSPSAHARDTDHPVQHLHLMNNGSYTISDIELKWITPEGAHKSNKFTSDLVSGKGFCLDLNKFGDVPDGSEVWLKVYIALGDNESCRKDNPRIYDADMEGDFVDKTQLYKIGGQASTNNLCKLSDGKETSFWRTNNTGNSNVCPVG